MKSKKYKIINIGKFKILREKNTRLTRIAGFLDKKNKIFPWYIKKFHETIQKNFQDKNISILALGMGIGMISHLNPNYKITYIEPDKELIKITKQEFNLPKKTKICTKTAKEFLDNLSKEKFNVIFYDIFTNNKMHWEELTPRYIKIMKSFLTKKGILIINIAAKKKEIKNKLNFLNYEIYSQYKNPIYKKINQNYIIKIKK